MFTAKEVDSKYKYFLAFVEDNEMMPILQGFSCKESRDEAYEQFLFEGKFEVTDAFTGIVRSAQPVLVAKLDLVGGKWGVVDKREG